MKRLLTILFVIGCASADRHDEPAPELRKILEMERAALTERLVRDHTENGWVVSRWEDGMPEHVGDSLLWTGLAMGSVPCEDGQLFSDTLRGMLKNQGGSLVRFEPLPQRYVDENRQVSFDSATGLYYGILARLLDCDEDPGYWAPVWELHVLAVESHNGRLHPDVPLSEAEIAPEFTVLPDMISHLLGMRGRPHSDRIALLETQLVGWAAATAAAEEPAFRIHLAWLYIRSLERLNELSDTARSSFCGATAKAEIPLLLHWCGQRHISKWDFQLNAYEYRHQRAKWEQPDGRQGLRTPGLDAIVAYAEALR